MLPISSHICLFICFYWTSNLEDKNELGQKISLQCSGANWSVPRKELWVLTSGFRVISFFVNRSPTAQTGCSMDCIFQKFNTTDMWVVVFMTSHCGFVNLVKHRGLGQTCWLPGFLFALQGGLIESAAEKPSYTANLLEKGGGGQCASLKQSILGEVHANLQLTQAVYLLPWKTS